MVPRNCRSSFERGWPLRASRVRYLNSSSLEGVYVLIGSYLAEIRAGGQPRRKRLEDSGDDYDLELDKQGSGYGGRSGRIILLGNGTEVQTDSDEQEVFDHEDDDRDLENQVSKHDAKTDKDMADLRSQREDTPGPQSHESTGTSKTPESTEASNAFESPSSTTSEKSEPVELASKVKTIPESALPDKLVPPPASKDT